MDKAKNRANLDKHGIDFADAIALFEDDFALTRPDPEARDEQRFITIGLMALGDILSLSSPSVDRASF